MNYDLNTDRINWKDECSWIGIALVSGLVLSLLFSFFDRFPASNPLVITFWSCVGFNVLSILLRLQNHRGEFWLGRTIHKESRIKVAFPVVGFVFGIALLVF